MTLVGPKGPWRDTRSHSASRQTSPAPPASPRRVFGETVQMRAELLVLCWPNILARFGFNHRCDRQPVHPGFPDPFGKMRADQQKASKQRDQRKPDKPSSTRTRVTEKESHGARLMFGRLMMQRRRSEYVSGRGCCDTATRGREHGPVPTTGVIKTKTAPGPNEGLAR
jgi:hypothetical protein